MLGVVSVFPCVSLVTGDRFRNCLACAVVIVCKYMDTQGEKTFKLYGALDYLMLQRRKKGIEDILSTALLSRGLPQGRLAGKGTLQDFARRGEWLMCHHFPCDGFLKIFFFFIQNVIIICRETV